MSRLLSFKDLRPSSWYNFSLDVSLTAPIIANTALYAAVRTVRSYLTVQNYWVDLFFQEILFLLQDHGQPRKVVHRLQKTWNLDPSSKHLHISIYQMLWINTEKNLLLLVNLRLYRRCFQYLTADIHKILQNGILIRIQSQIKSRFFGLHVFFAFFSK